MEKFSRILIYTAIGATPGVVMVLLALFVIEGEMELTVGAPGFLIAGAGAVAGCLYGLRRNAKATMD